MNFKTWIEGIDDARLGRCYPLAGLKIMIGEPDHILVHGHVSYEGNQGVDHAWVEIGRVVYEPVSDRLFKKDVFYSEFNARPRKTYTRSDAMALYRKHKHWGPWD